ncbi:pyridoxamine 5'-phosphate oxidase-related FMN-binding [Parafrankia sp. EAN1pec]|uniref:PPOX class F420-dependent oxidoreductase n=1 Tax=Parafrankia sp. (strain EAN1pec) TaxID=298653 RepID=UPI0000542C28|nr:pyridoxamine 5'-phosphate oxidase-related FMN-binding [Frankia sp. EAN1pec]
MGKLDDGAKELLEKPFHGWVTTLTADGSPHSTVVWVDVDGGDVLFNTAVGRVKEKHLRKDPRVSVGVLDPEDRYHLVSVTGTATLDTEGADAHIDRLAKKYLGVDSYPFRKPGEQRIIVRITPSKVVYNAGS